MGFLCITIPHDLLAASTPECQFRCLALSIQNLFFLLASKFIKQQGVVIIVPEVESKASDELPDLVVKIVGKYPS